MSTAKKYLTKDDILNHDGMKIEEVEAFGGTVLVRALSGQERDDFEKNFIDTDGKLSLDSGMFNMRARLVSKTLCDEKGKRLFSDDVGTVVDLGKKCAADLQKVFAVAQRLSGISSEDVEELKKS